MYALLFIYICVQIYIYKLCVLKIHKFYGKST